MRAIGWLRARECLETEDDRNSPGGGRVSGGGVPLSSPVAGQTCKHGDATDQASNCTLEYLCTVLPQQIDISIFNERIYVTLIDLLC